MPRAPLARRSRCLAALAALIVACALPLGLAGCGDGSLSASDLRTQASAICQRSADAAARVSLPASEDRGAAFLAAGLTRMRPALAKLERLDPPSDMREGYRQALHVRREEIDSIARSQRAIANGADAVGTYRALQATLTSLESLEDATWRALQVPACVPR